MYTGRTAAHINVLGVDDGNGSMSSLREVFFEHGFIFTDAGSTREGLEIVRLGKRFDVIISDYLTQDMSGIDFLHDVRRYQPKTLRILLSNQAPYEEIQAAFTDDIVHFHLLKPLDNEVLLALIKVWIVIKPAMPNITQVEES